MKIGVAKEIKSDEYRVALTPAGARELVQRGHEVLVETGAGDGSSFPDAAYEAVGARIASVDEVWADAELLLKVKEPIAAEYPRLRDGLVALHVPPPRRDEPLTRGARRQRRTAVAYETVETDDRRAAAARADERGRRAARRRRRARTSSRSRSAAAASCSAACPGVAPGRCVVIGGGIVGYNAAVIALGLGAQRDDPRALDRPDAPPRGDPLRPRQLRDVVDAPDRGVGRRRRRRDRRGADPRRASRRSSSRARCSATMKHGRRARRRRDRPGRLRRDLARRRRTPTRSTSSTASPTTASRTCPARCRSPRRRR